MTREKTIRILKYRKRCIVCVADCNCDECDNAFDIAIKTLDEVEKYKKAIEEIKADISGLSTSYCGGYIGLDKQEVLNIIDKHVEEVTR